MTVPSTPTIFCSLGISTNAFELDDLDKLLGVIATATRARGSIRTYGTGHPKPWPYNSWNFELQVQGFDHADLARKLLATFLGKEGVIREISESKETEVIFRLYAHVPEDASLPIWEFGADLLANIARLGATMTLDFEYVGA